MRKTLAVLALMIGSLLFLAAPAWAHHLYRINKVTTNGTTNTYEALTDRDCASGVRIRPNSSTVVANASPDGTKAYDSVSPTPKRHLFSLKTSVKFSSALKANCGTELMTKSASVLGASVPRAAMARTGRPLVPQLAFAIGLLLVGSLLVALTVRPKVAVLARRRPGPPAAD
jgi:hypothetical protein